MAADKTILLVEDNPDDVALMKRALKKAGLPLKLIVAENGAEALDYAFATGRWRGRGADTNPDVILLDLKLPGLDGIDVLRRLRGDRRTKNVPVVVLTGSESESDLIRSYNLGCNSFIRKPTEFGDFVEEVRKLGQYWVTNEPPPTRQGREPAPSSGGR